MTLQELLTLISSGEDSQTQFKSDVTNADSLAAEMVAFSNTRGGTICIGVSDDGQLVGVPLKNTGRINQLISNAASQHVRSPIAVQTINVSVADDAVVMLVQIQEGLDKPYFDKNGIIWLKNGADKRRINSKEGLQRLFQSNNLIHADEVPSKAELEKIDKGYFAEFLSRHYQQSMPKTHEQLHSLLNNMGLAVNNQLTLAGVMLFSANPQFSFPAFVCKAIHFPGNDISVDHYLDSEDFEGNIESQFKGLMSFVLRSLKKRQSGQGVNSSGIPEIPKIVFEELIVNALVHRDYFVSAAIRLFVFENRIELISPGHLPNHLTVAKIEAGNSNIRNPILASFAFKGILPYRGLGTGIRRAIADWPQITFIDDREANQFKVIIYRSSDLELLDFSLKQGGMKKNDLKIKVINCLANSPKASYETLATQLAISPATIKRILQELKRDLVVERDGARRGGVWRIVDDSLLHSRVGE